jgi:hypothetical protein
MLTLHDFRNYAKISKDLNFYMLFVTLFNKLRFLSATLCFPVIHVGQFSS